MDETAQQVSSLVTHQTTVDRDLAALRDRTTGLLSTVNILNDRTVHISTSLGNLSQATASSQEYIRELTRVLNKIQGGANIAINNLITQVRAELTPLIQAIDTHPQTLTVPAISRSDNTATTQEVPTPSTSSPSDPLKASGESGKATAEYTFHLRTRIGDCPKYNRDRMNNTAYFWTTKAYL
jgi:hypothetical protein